MSDEAYHWHPLTPEQVNELLTDLPIPWWIAGGWAIDLFLSHPTRKHEDIDILILRKDQFALQEHLQHWDLHKTGQLGLKPWPRGEYLAPGVNDIWCRRDAASPWAMQFMLMETEENQWVYRRQPEIRGDIATLGTRTINGLPYLKPEIQLLYKAKAQTLEKDQQDFDVVLPCLNQAAQQWLLVALSLQFVEGHEWIQRLSASAGIAR